MNRLIKFIIVTATLLLPSFISAQTPLPGKERNKVVNNIVSAWNDWQTLSISGKLKMAGLPLNPSVKIYMEKDSLIRISVRAPFMGEVGRAEIEGDTLLVVNKMKKTFVKEPIDSVSARYPLTLGDVQALLLGRVVIPGEGTLAAEISESVELYPEDYGEYSLIPAEGSELDEFNYGYLIDDTLRASVLLVIPVGKPEISLNVTYEYEADGYNLSVSYQSPEKIYGGSLQLNYPTEEGNPIEPIKLNSKYRRLNIAQFMKSF